MKVRVEIWDKEKENGFDGTLELPSDFLLHGPFDLFDKDGNKFGIEVKARSDGEKYLQLLFFRETKEWVSFEFRELETGEEQILFVGRDSTWKFTKSPWTVAVTKLAD